MNLHLVAIVAPCTTHLYFYIAQIDLIYSRRKTQHMSIQRAKNPRGLPQILLPFECASMAGALIITSPFGLSISMC